jgi:hypothetical protein
LKWQDTNSTNIRTGLALHGQTNWVPKAEIEQQKKNLDDVTLRTTIGDHKTHSSSRKNKTNNWNPVRAGRKSNDERTEKLETSFSHGGALLPKIELQGAATHASTIINPNLRVGSQETEWGNENAGEQKILAIEGRDQGLNQF